MRDVGIGQDIVRIAPVHPADIAVASEGQPDGRGRCLREDLDRGVDGRFLEHLVRTKIEPLFEMPPFVNQPPQPFAVFERRPQVGRDVAHPPMPVQQRKPLLDERQVEIEIARLRRTIRPFAARARNQPVRHVGMDLGEILQLHIWRVADYRVEAAEGEIAIPLERVDAVALFFVGQVAAFVEVAVDQAVATADVVVEAGQGLLGFGGMEPQR